MKAAHSAWNARSFGLILAFAIATGGAASRAATAALESTVWGEAVDGLQGRIQVEKHIIQPGEDVQLTFSLRVADSKQKESIYVWDNKYSRGYLNDSYIVSTPDGKSRTLRQAEHDWTKNAPSPVEIKPGTPWQLGGVAGEVFVKSLRALGLDTSKPGKYVIQGVYEEAAGKDDLRRTNVSLWGGKLTTPPIEVVVTAQKDPIAWGKAVDGLQAGILPLGGGEAKGWPAAFVCPKCPTNFERNVPGKCSECGAKTGSSVYKTCESCAAAKRVCQACGASKPWSATFVEGEPLVIEAHFRNVAKTDLAVYDGGPPCWSVRFTNTGRGEVWNGTFPGLIEYAVRAISLRPDKETSWDVWVIQGGSWTFKDARPSMRETLPDTKTLSPGKYTVVAEYRSSEGPHWQGKVTSGSIEIELKPKGKAEGEVSDEKPLL